MNVDFAYGTSGRTLTLPEERTTVVSGKYPPALPLPQAAITSALRHPIGSPPLRDLVRKNQTVAVAICDGTRPQPHQLVVSTLLEELATAVRLEDIVVLVAGGTHRANTLSELEAMLGRDLLSSVRVVNHDARDDQSLTWVGQLGQAVPVWLSSEWLAADIRVTTGLVEPHFFAGFSGGPKLVAPGLAGLETTLFLHNASRIGHPQARWGVTVGNPVHDDIRAIAFATGVDFALDVIVNRSHQVVAVFGGDVLQMHRAACEASRAFSMRAVPHLFDLVVTSNAGYPLDQNLYQAVKGMSAAAQVVKPGGTVLCLAECRDGFPDHGSYKDELFGASSPSALLKAIKARSRTHPDQWQLQVQADIMSKAKVVVSTGYLSDEELAAAHLEQAHDIEAIVARAGPDATICALPEGPMTVPYVG